MPRTFPLPGTTATVGTQHHCPGEKISRYIKEGPCRKNNLNYCKTHQIRCPDPQCQKENFAFLEYEPCVKCAQRAYVSCYTSAAFWKSSDMFNRRRQSLTSTPVVRRMRPKQRLGWIIRGERRMGRDRF